MTSHSGSGRRAIVFALQSAGCWEGQMHGFNRRTFVALLGSAAASVSPHVARAQQPGRLPTIGFLGSGTPESQGGWAIAFVKRMAELGWIEGRSISIEQRWGEGRAERFAEIAADFVRRKV